MNRDKKTRYYTIQRRWRKSRSGLISRKAIPEIRISGIWLLKEGFFPSGKIRIEIRKKYIDITPYKPVA
ncbi:MAG: type I toxin-antitoxin system SymE family toxin [Bacteroidetes bacterium]|nr:type I toxin-antitoxin system SymE family toxin [Bacteroidota bacterium]